MSKKIIYDESLDSEIQFKKFVATQAPENHEISDEDVEQMEMANLIDLEIQDHENFMNQVRDSYCEYDSYDDYLIEEQYMDKIEEPFDLEQEYDKWDDYSDCIDSDLEYKEYQQEQFRKEDSIEGPMSCFEHGYYMDESSNSDYDERSFMEEYDFEDNLTFEMESEIYGSDFKSEMDDYGEEEYYQKQIAEHERQIKEDELKQMAEYERQIREDELKQMAEHERQIREDELKQMAEHERQIREDELKQIAEHERQIREDELKQIAEHERQFPEGK